MPRALIDDLDDPRVAIYRHLKATNQTRGSDLFVVEGESLLDRLIASPQFPVVSALASDRKADRIDAKLPADVPLFVVRHERLNELVGFNFHRGALGCGRMVPWPSPLDLVRRVIESSPDQRVTLLVCPETHNPENLGAFIRDADVFGADAILAGTECPSPLSRRVLRVSMGTALRLPTYRLDDLAGTLDALRARLDVATVAAVVDPSAEPIGTFQRPQRLALLLGNEANGLGPDWLARSDRRVTIPMRPGASSLNVAVAGGILLHHLMAPARD